MTKTVLYISPQFPTNFVNFVESLRRAGCKVLGVADAHYDSLDHRLKSNLNDYVQVGNMEDYEQVYLAVARLIGRNGRIHVVQSHNEHWLTLEAQIREDFNIKDGYRVDEINNFKKKSFMKGEFRSIGAKVARGIVTDSMDKVIDFVHGEDGVGFPIVVKPDSGVGAVGSFRINNDADLQQFFAVEYEEDYIFEEYIEGKLFTFDGLTNANGEILWYGSFEYNQGVMETFNNNTHSYYYIKRDVPENVYQLGKKLVSMFKVKGHFFHFEFFRTPKGEIVPLEVNLRLPGGWTVDMYNYASNIDLYQMWADVVADKPLPIPTKCSPKYTVCFTSRKNHVKYTHHHNEIMSKCVFDEPEGDQIQVVQEIDLPELYRRVLGDHAYIFRSQNENTVLNFTNFVMS